MPTTKFGDISQRTAAWAANEMLAHAEPCLVLTKFGQIKPIPANTADTVKFRRPNPFPPALTEITEGVTPPNTAMSYTDVAVTLKQYGMWTEITDKVQDMAEDPVLKDATMLCGENAGETQEALAWGVVTAGTNVAFANGGARNQVNTPPSLNMLRGAVRFLKAQRAKVITEMLSGSTHIKTEPVGAAFFAFGSSDLEADIRNLPGFTAVENYGQATKAVPFEIGKCESIRFVLAPHLTGIPNAGGNKGAMKSTGGTTADVYPLVVVAKDSFGHVPLKGKTAIRPMVLNPDTPRGGDQLGQRGSVGWKSYYAAVRLNEAWMIRLECAVTNL